MRATFPANLILFDLNTRIFREEYTEFSSSLRSLLHTPVNSSLLDRNILLSTLCSDTVSLRSSLNVSSGVPRGGVWGVQTHPGIPKV